MKFVQEVATFVKENNLPLKDLKIILPSERMKKYLHAALFEVYGRPIIAPEITTIEQWVKSLSKPVVIDKTRVLVELFKIQLKHAKTEEDKSFDEFLTWGEILLSDFNDIDRYLIEARQVFKNLADIKEIENWSFGNETLSPAQIRFMEFWDRLPVYYLELKEKLEKMNKTYAAAAYKELSNNIQLAFEKNKKQQFIFAGFNALSPAELSIIKQLEQMGRAHLLLNGDRYYVSNPSHEAGMFLRNTQTVLGNNHEYFIGDQLSSKEMEVNIIECAQNTGQVKVMSTLLEQLSENDFDETLLLLADESLINSVVRNLPARIKNANITLGTPIKNSSVRQWVELLFSIQENKTRFKTNAVYYSDLQKLWNHPFVQALLDQKDSKLINDFETEMTRNNKIFINHRNHNLGETMANILDKMCDPWQGDWLKAIHIIKELNQTIYQKLNDKFAFERAILTSFDSGVSEFENLLLEGIPEMSFRSFRHLFNQSWVGKNIAYHGNPIKGLQIMGLLESRGLDFKRIICLGMSEGHLPPTNPIQTMIPMDLRKYFGLPTPREKQGIFAHHFYRLMHKAERIDITYCSADETIGFSEPSRYILQMEKELGRLNPRVKINKMIYSLELNQKKHNLLFPKTEDILARLDEKFAVSTSASMLKKYTTCPLDFYYRYVLEFGEEDSVEEEIESNTFGTFIHSALERMYTPFARRDKDGVLKEQQPPQITSHDVKKMLGSYEMILEDEFLKHFNNDREAFLNGKNYLAFRMAKELTDRFLKSEIKFLEVQTAPVFIEALEQQYEAEIEVEVAGILKKVKLNGYIDRIDSIDGAIRIIDYKSGKVAEEDVKGKTMGTEEEMIQKSLRESKHFLQLLQYAFLYHQKHNVIASASIISFISNDQKPFPLSSTKLDLNELIKNYPAHLSEIFTEIYNTDIPFEHNAAQYYSYCNYCD